MGPQPTPSNRIGATLRAKWRIEAQLGKGSMASVYAATHRNGTRVAIKILHPHLARDPQVQGRFLREGYLANRVNHEGTVKVLDDDVAEDGCAFLVMELLDGQTLEQRRRACGGRIPIPEALAYGDLLLQVIGAAHQAGIIHRDLKPENVFLTREGLVKVLDFGVANLLDGRKSSEMTVTGMVIGTPSFMAPEQALGLRDEVDARSDLWAVGACLFTILSGQMVHPEQGSAVLKILTASQAKPRSVATVAPDLPPRLVAIVDKSVSFDKKDRYRDAASFRAALLEFGDNWRMAEAMLGEVTQVAPRKLTSPDDHEIPTRRTSVEDVAPITARDDVDSGWDDDAEPSTERMQASRAPSADVGPATPVVPAPRKAAAALQQSGSLITSAPPLDSPDPPPGAKTTLKGIKPEEPVTAPEPPPPPVPPPAAAPPPPPAPVAAPPPPVARTLAAGTVPPGLLEPRPNEGSAPAAAVAVPQTSSAVMVVPQRAPSREPPVFETGRGTPQPFPPPPLKAQLEDIPMNASPLRVILPVGLALVLALGGYFGLSAYYRGKAAVRASASAAASIPPALSSASIAAVQLPPSATVDATTSTAPPQSAAPASADPPPKPSVAIPPRPWKPGGRKPRTTPAASATASAAPPPPAPPPPTATIPTPITPPGDPVPP